MKKRTTLFLTVLFSCLALFCAARAEGRKLTVMVYMCGSNLESGYGSATADMEEMQAAGISPRDVSLIVMTGGSSYWEKAYSPSEVCVTEIGARGSRIVWRSEQMNMGGPETLTALLRFGQEKYPAEDYALILWDHGGGPLEGVCWDELFSMDSLTLSELTEALKAAELPRPLRWIGFDACLMSSLEVAAAVSPYADYMIASQETEPAFGWNYAFLNGIEKDESGAATGERIVDAYFAGHEDSKDVLTLCCTDLKKTAAVLDAFDPFFGPVAEGMDQQRFDLISGLRMSAVSFGEGARALGDTGYDLVDARDLVSRLPGGEAEKAEILRLLDEAVVCSRSNVEGPGGLTLYHPYENKEKYLSKWHENYTGLGFSSGYTRYVESFGSILTGGALFRWENLVTEAYGADGSGAQLFGLPLTPAQRDSLLSAQLLIVCDTFTQNPLTNGCVTVASCPAELDENGVLTARYDGLTLYVESEDGELIGPASFILTDDGRYDLVYAVYVPEDSWRLQSTVSVLYYLDAENPPEYPEIFRTRVWDEATQSFSSRIAFSEEHYRLLYLWNRLRVYPGPGENGVLPAFQDWERYEHGMSMYGLSLPDDWRFRFVREQVSGVQLHAMFEITDTQHNRYCSVPVPVANPNLTPLVPESGSFDTDAFSLSLSGSVNSSSLSRSAELILTAENRGTEDAALETDGFLLNGERYVKHRVKISVPAGSSVDYTLSVPGDHFVLMDSLDSLSFSAVWTSGGETLEEEAIFRFSGADVARIAPPAEFYGECERDGITLRLMKIEPSAGGMLAFTFLVENGSGYVFNPSALSLNGFRTETMVSESLPPDTSQVVTVVTRNHAYLSSMEMTLSGADTFLYDVVLSDRILQSHGFDEITRLSLGAKLYEAGGHMFSAVSEPVLAMELSRPWIIREPENVEEGMNMIRVYTPPEELRDFTAPYPVLADADGFRVSLRSVFLGENGVGLALEVENRSDRELLVQPSGCSVNGSSPVSASVPHASWLGLDPSPGETLVTGMILTGGALAEPGCEVSSVGVSFFREGREDAVHSAEIILNRPAALGEPLGVWIGPDGFRVVPSSGDSAGTGPDQAE